LQRLESNLWCEEKIKPEAAVVHVLGNML